MARNNAKNAAKTRNQQMDAASSVKEEEFENSIIVDVVFNEASGSYDIVHENNPVAVVAPAGITLHTEEEATFKNVRLTIGGVTSGDVNVIMPVLAALEVTTDVELIVDGIKVTSTLPVLPEPTGEQLVMVLGASPTQYAYRTGKGSISNVAAAIGCNIIRLAADQGFGVTINFDLELKENIKHFITIAFNEMEAVTHELANVSGGVGLIIQDPKLAQIIIEYGKQAKAIGFTISREQVEEEVVKEEGAFDPENAPSIFFDQDELVTTFLHRLWAYIRLSHESLSQTPQSVSDNIRRLITVFDQITNLETDEFGLIMPSLEAIYEEYASTVFSERLATRGISSIADNTQIQRLLALLNILRVVNNTTNQDKLHLVLDLRNLHLHGFNQVQSENITSYFNIQ